MKQVKVGVIGCGAISQVYFQNLKDFEIIKIAAAADLMPERAEAKAQEFGCCACSVDELLADPEIEIVVNLTIPLAHAGVALKVLEAGKSVYNEKPLAVKREDGQQMLAVAKEKGLLVGGAPDTFLGYGHQTCRKAIDAGLIGEPVAATAFMVGHGHESWHPSPEFYYHVGGGPMFDMGPYYLTALVNMLGPIRRVTGSTRITFPERIVTSKPKYGTVVKVEIGTHVAGVMDFANGAIGTIITSFDVWSHNLPIIEIYGTEGSLRVPDPNGFGGDVYARRAGEQDWAKVVPFNGYTKNRGVGVADMAYALRTGRKNRAGGELTYHVLDVMQAFYDASDTGKHVMIESTCERPAPMPEGLRENVLDE